MALKSWSFGGAIGVCTPAACGFLPIDPQVVDFIGLFRWLHPWHFVVRPFQHLARIQPKALIPLRFFDGLDLVSHVKQ